MKKDALALGAAFSILVQAVSMGPAALARKADPDSPLTPEQQSLIDKGAHQIKNKHAEEAKQSFAAALNTAGDVPKCLAIATYTESYGYPLLEARRMCMQKALSLCSTTQDYMQVALSCRKYNCYDITRSAIDKVISTASTPTELFDLAHKAHEAALMDVAHLAMEKAYTLTKSVDSALVFTKEARVLGMDDLVRKCVKDVIDDEQQTHPLLVWLQNIEPLNLTDLNRYLLKKALDDAANLDEYFEVLKAAKRHGQADIVSLTLYRGKRKNIIDQMKKDQAAYQEQLGAQQQKTQQDLNSANTGGGNGSSAAGF